MKFLKKALFIAPLAFASNVCMTGLDTDTISNKIKEIKSSHPANLMAKHFDPSYFRSLPKDL